jgi:hypothetical protein
MPNPQNIEPYKFKKGQGGRPKGARNYKVLLREALIEVGKSLKLGKEPDQVLVEIVKKGIKQALRGNYPFYKDILDRLYGQAKQTIETEEKRVLVLIDEDEEEKEKEESGEKN